VAVQEVRRALGDDAAAPRFIETVHGRGYRFISSVDTAERVLTGTAKRRETAGTTVQTVGRLARSVASLDRIALLIAGALLGWAFLWSGTPPESQNTADTVSRFALEFPPGEFPMLGATSLAWTPDGRRLMYRQIDREAQVSMVMVQRLLYRLVDREAQVSMLMVRPLDAIEAYPVSGTEMVLNAFPSADGEWIGYVRFDERGRVLAKVPIEGGEPTVLLRDNNLGSKASWGPDNNIVYWTMPTVPDPGLWSIGAEGGVPTRVTLVDRERGEWSHSEPMMLPAGTGILFTLERYAADEAVSSVAVVSLADGSINTLVDDASAPRYLSSGVLVVARGDTLMLVPFDQETLKTTGELIPVQYDVFRCCREPSTSHFAVSDNGHLAYIPGGILKRQNQLRWIGMDGQPQPEPWPGEDEFAKHPVWSGRPTLSPDGRRLALIEDGEVWVFDRETGILSRESQQDEEIWGPVAWSPDSRRFMVRSETDGTQAVTVRELGATQPERVATGDLTGEPVSWSPDGSHVVLQVRDEDTGNDLWLVNVDTDSEPIVLANTDFDEVDATFSPDGRWIAYTTGETLDSAAIFVIATETPGRRWQVSGEFGLEPRWAPDGDELYYVNREAVMAVRMRETADGPEFERPRRLFDAPYGIHGGYDVAPDGSGMVYLEWQPMVPPPPRIHIAVNWLQEVAGRVGRD